MRESSKMGERLGLLLVLAVVAGLLLAGLALPFVGGIGLLAKKQSDALGKLPASLVTPPLPQHSLLLAADGSTIATLAGTQDRVVVGADQIPPVMETSIVAIEDNRFFQHNGVDIRGVLRAASADTSSGGFSQGASTITEQYVKLVEQESATTKQAQAAATEKSLNRKLRDARLAIALEKQLTKQQILTNYLNIAYFGEGSYGVGTAAQHYFGIPISRVSLAQAAFLAGIVNNPTSFDPIRNPRDSLARRNAVLDAVAKYRLQPPAAVAKARATKLVVHPTSTSGNHSCDASKAPLFCSYVLQQLAADPKLGATVAVRETKIYEGGLKIYTTYDPKTQAATNAGIAQHLPDSVRQVSSTVSIQPGTGNILAIGQNRAWGAGANQTKNIYASIPAYDVGSTFKLMTLTAAVQQGIPLTTSINSPACLKIPGVHNAASTFCPDGLSNSGDTSEHGVYDLYSGTWDSVNTFFLQLETKVGGPSTVAAMAKTLGIVGSKTFQAGSYGASLTLGAGGGFSPIDMATAYATIAAHGLECTPTAVSRLTTLTGAAVPLTVGGCRQAVPTSVADTVTSILQGVLNKSGATGAQIHPIGRPAAGKTGTLDGGTGGWFVGYTPQVTTAVGIFDPKRTGSPATPITDLASGTTFDSHSFFGASIAGPLWSSIMSKALSGLPVEYFTLPEASDPGGFVKPAASPRPSGSPGPPAPTNSAPSTPPAVTPPAPKPSKSKKK